HIISEPEYSLSYDKEFYTEDAVLDMEINDIIYNSADARAAVLFFCIVGAKADGHNYAKKAYDAGVRIFVCERVLSLGRDAIQVVVEDSRTALAKMSACFFDHPERKLKIIGVTGTKGKSSVCEMIYHIFNFMNRPTALIGTIGIKIGGKTEPTENSTPESYILFKSFAKMIEAGIEFVAMEVSSQAIYLDRIYGIEFAASIVTNIYEDHIGPYEHPNFAHYKNCKKEILHRSRRAFLNEDDAYCGEFLSYASCPVVTYGIDHGGDICASNIASFNAGNIFGVSFDCTAFGKSTAITLPVPGKFSVYNALSAIAVCRVFGISIFDAAEALRTVRIKGRFEIVETPLEKITCVIDYAHNGESLRNVLQTIRGYSPKRIICVFGSVGGRTKNRRKDMAVVANELSDICVVTSDNPDAEDPDEIIREISRYIDKEKCVNITDREKAIYYALENAKEGDFLLFAGKGHEEYQLINGVKTDFSEKNIIRRAAASLVPKI
ncbi:MAG: UDP-N-acetylmuramoyl-L-alanyl-D-glutamate--2,6-diaminopimelate ligase, partial [Eubacteriales bacterium]